MKNQQIIQELESTTAQLLQALGQIDEKQFNTRPGTDKWSAGEILEHLCIIDNLVEQVLMGETQPAGERPPDAQEERIRRAFMNFDNKYTAYPSVQPTALTKHKDELIRFYTENRKVITDVARKLDLTELCTSLEHPVFGQLTRQEWIHYCIYHDTRHLRQLQAVNEYLR